MKFFIYMVLVTILTVEVGTRTIYLLEEYMGFWPPRLIVMPLFFPIGWLFGYLAPQWTRD